jgi:hypothetical protein
MTLDDELRAMLDQQADMEVTSRPDEDRLILARRTRRRRRTLSRICGTTLAVTILGGGVYVVAQGDRGEAGAPDIAMQKTGTPEPSVMGVPPPLAADPGSDDLEPGTYRVIVGRDADGAMLWADLTFEGEHWQSGDYPVLHQDNAFGGFGVYRPDTLAAGDGCTGGAVDQVETESPQLLARHLTELPKSTVIEPVTPTSMLGRPALHVRVRIAQTCPVKRYYQVAQTLRGSRGVTYGLLNAPAVIDFWVLDVDGVTVVVDRWHDQGAPAELVDRIARASESIAFVSRP